MSNTTVVKVPSAQAALLAEGKAASEKYPAAVGMVEMFKTAYASVMDAYRALVQGLRGQNMAPRELTAFLLFSGFDAPKASAIKRIVEAPVELYAQYMQGLGLNATLKSLREGGAGGQGISSLPASVSDLFQNAANTGVALPVWRVGKTVVKLKGWTVVVQVRRAKIVKAGSVKKGKKGKKAKV